MSTVTVSPSLRKKLAELKLELGYKSIDQLLTTMVADFTQSRLSSASAEFRRRLADKGVTVEALIRENKRIRREVYREWIADESR